MAENQSFDPCTPLFWQVMREMEERFERYFISGYSSRSAGQPVGWINVYWR